jgi:hypothetical protein
LEHEKLQELLHGAEALREQMQLRNNELEGNVAKMAERVAYLQTSLVDGKRLTDELQARLSTMVDRAAHLQICNERDRALRELSAEKETVARTKKHVARLEARATSGMSRRMIARAAYDEACRALHELEDLHASMLARHQQDLEHIAMEVAGINGAHHADRSIQTQNSISTILKEIDALQHHVQTLKSGHAETVALMQLRIDELESTVACRMIDLAVHETVCHERDTARANLSALQSQFDLERARGPFLTSSFEAMDPDVLFAKLHSIASHLQFLGDASEKEVDSRLCEAGLSLMEAAEALEGKSLLSNHLLFPWQPLGCWSATGLAGSNIVAASSVCATFLVELSTHFRSALRISKQLVSPASARHRNPPPSHRETSLEALGEMHAELHSLRGELVQARNDAARLSDSLLEGRRRLDCKRDAWDATRQLSERDRDLPSPIRSQPSSQLGLAARGGSHPLANGEKVLESIAATKPLMNLVLMRRMGHTDQVDIQLVPHEKWH